MLVPDFVKMVMVLEKRFPGIVLGAPIKDGTLISPHVTIGVIVLPSGKVLGTLQGIQKEDIESFIKTEREKGTTLITLDDLDIAPTPNTH